MHCEQEPKGRSNISLAHDRDQLGLLRTRLAWHVSATELHTIRTFVDIAGAALAGVARVLPEAALLAGEEGAVASCVDSFHHMGGMRMDRSAEHGVTDPDLRLHGTLNVNVCSTAVFPTSGFSNPTHTLIALAIRLAERLDQSL